VSRLIGPIAIYGAMILGCTAAGFCLLLAPVRVGNLIHESLYLFPEVRPSDWAKKLFLRLAGTGLLVFALRFALRIARQLG